MVGGQGPTPGPIMRLLLVWFILVTAVQADDEVYRVYTEHPRLYLRPQRLKLLKRERERQSMRWRHFDTLVSSGASMPEPGFDLALHYSISGNREIGKRAVEWALGPGADLRQMALVFDWCQDLMTEAQGKALAGKIQKAVAAKAGGRLADVGAQRDRALAAISIAEVNPDLAESVLREVAEGWWKGSAAPGLNRGENFDPGAQLFALLELLHAVRDNLNIELRPSAGDYFKALPSFEVACNYPSPLGSVENEYFIPVFNGSGEPDLKRASQARAAGLATVAYDTNAQENQFLQGWLIQDRFMLQGPFGSAYEFLWANPYQPGLAYVHLPLTFHDKRSGILFVRSDWEEEASWFGYYEGQAQIYREGKITVLDLKGRTAKGGPLMVGKTSIVLAREGLRAQAAGGPLFILGGRPKTAYDIEVDGEEVFERESDVAGTISILFAEEQTPGIRLKESPRGK